MSKKRKRAHPVQSAKPKDAVVWRQSAEEATLAAKPRYNGFACGHGAHGPAKYSRARAKQAWKRQMRQEGAPRGSFPFVAEGRALACQIAEEAVSSPCPPRLCH
ncbi:hypothetical protein GKZ27_08350 [Enterorhabdus mucosicola]|uniref:Uncharacterized protein n=1 Tax=Adlercreutzia mucosicola TaxID=580026 RepID=A0A6N8JPE1_9ACTN|nr:hypothetical protein [Adlercreutzia mucosicola]MVX61462.1 hypothetical protein [Adlercreutzia mucosicola]